MNLNMKVQGSRVTTGPCSISKIPMPDLKLRGFLLTLFCILSFTAELAALEEVKGVCFDGPLRIRKEPGTSSAIVGRLATDEEFIVTGRTSYRDRVGKDNNFWYEIRTGSNQTGYVYGAFIRVSGRNYGTVFQWNGNSYDYINDVYHWRLYEIEDSEIEFLNSDVRRIISGEVFLVDYSEEKEAFLIVAPDMYGRIEYGFIGKNSLKVDDSFFYREVEGYSDVSEVPPGGGRWDRFREMEMLKAHPEMDRNGPVLQLGNGIDIIDKGRSGPEHILLGIYGRFCFILQSYYEGSECFLINTETQQKIEHLQRSLVFSPDGTMFMNYGNSYMDCAEYRIFAYRDGVYELIYEHYFNEEYFPDGGFYYYIQSSDWVDDGRINLTFNNDNSYELVRVENDWDLVSK